MIAMPGKTSVPHYHGNMKSKLLVYLALLIVTFFCFSLPVWAQTMTTFSFTPASDLQDGQLINKKFICPNQGGVDQTPSLQWINPPAGTQSFVLIMNDPDAPNGNWVHWMVYNIPGSTTQLAADSNYPLGKNSWGNVQYQGPCPPLGKIHHYVFTLYALSVPSLNFPHPPSYMQLTKAIQDVTLASITMTTSHQHP